ncbi:MAG: hypothetical protein ACI81R_002160 [Bradymonadia bacterium]|jgi:hypothetical protein
MTRLLTALLSIALLAPVIGCSDVLDDARELATLRRTIDFEVPQALPIAFPSNSVMQQMQNQGEDEYPIQFYVPIDLSSQAEWLTSRDIVEAVNIVGVTMVIEDNTLTTPIEPVEFRVGRTDGLTVVAPGLQSDIFAEAIQVSITPVIDAQSPPFTGAVDSEIVPANTAAASAFIKELNFGIGMGTILRIPAGTLPEGGSANARFTLQLEFVVNPL